jgi:hypothetical protein
MAEHLTKQPLVVYGLTIVELNDVLRKIQVELDRLSGLSGTIELYDHIHIQDDNGQVIHGYGPKP